MPQQNLGRCLVCVIGNSNHVQTPWLTTAHAPTSFGRGLYITGGARLVSGRYFAVIEGKIRISIDSDLSLNMQMKGDVQIGSSSIL